MSVLDVAMSLATSQSDKLAKFLGKSPEQVKSAMTQAKKMLPELMANPTVENGADVLNRIGVDKAFLDDAFNKYSPYASKIGLSGKTIRPVLNAIKNAMGGNRPSASSKSSRPTAGFDKSKYPKI